MVENISEAKVSKYRSAKRKNSGHVNSETFEALSYGTT